MTKQLGRGIVAAISIFLLSGASAAQAQTLPANAGRVDAAAQPLGDVGQSIARVAASVTAPVTSAITTVSNAFSPAIPTRATAGPDVAREAAWLHRNGWPLYALVDRYGASAPQLDEQANCIATAVYHEARGETLEGQLAVARVIMNRAASGKYPSTWCATVKQPWQFSFVNPRTGAFPYTDFESASWRKAVGVTRLAIANAVPSLPTDCLWYHADYVSPSWGRRLNRIEKIGTHIFYRA